MKVVLTEKVRSLGNVGEIVNVTEGYARNYLIPKRFAIMATEGNQKYIEDQQRRLNKKILDQKTHALDLKKKLDGVMVELSKKVGGNGKLFGTVTNSELVKELEAKQIEIERKWIHLESPIKQLGEFPVRVKIFADVEAQFKVRVIMDAQQAEELKRKQELGLKKSKAKKEGEEGAAAGEGQSAEATAETETSGEET